MLNRLLLRLSQWRTIYLSRTHYRYRRDNLAAAWEQLWLCKVRGQHQPKMDTGGRCYRCGR